MGFYFVFKGLLCGSGICVNSTGLKKQSPICTESYFLGFRLPSASVVLHRTSLSNSPRTHLLVMSSLSRFNLRISWSVLH